MEQFAFFAWIVALFALADFGILLTPMVFGRKGYQPRMGVMVGALWGVFSGVVSIFVIVPVFFILLGILSREDIADLVTPALLATVAGGVAATLYLIPVYLQSRAYNPRVAAGEVDIWGQVRTIIVLFVVFPIFVLLMAGIADDLKFTISIDSGENLLPVNFLVAQDARTITVAFMRALLTGVLTFVFGMSLMNVLWRLLPDQRFYITILPEGEDLKRNTESRRLRGYALRIHYFVAVVIGLFVLTALLWNVVKSTFTMAAVNNSIEPETLTEDGRPLSELNTEELSTILVGNINSQRASTLFQEEVWGVDRVTAQELNTRRLSEVVDGELLFEDFPRELPYGELAANPTASQDILIKNLSRDEMAALTASELPQAALIELMVSRLAPQRLAGEIVIYDDFSNEDINALILNMINYATPTDPQTVAVIDKYTALLIREDARAELPLLSEEEMDALTALSSQVFWQNLDLDQRAKILVFLLRVNDEGLETALTAEVDPTAFDLLDVQIASNGTFTITSDEFALEDGLAFLEPYMREILTHPTVFSERSLTLQNRELLAQYSQSLDFSAKQQKLTDGYGDLDARTQREMAVEGLRITRLHDVQPLETYFVENGINADYIRALLPYLSAEEVEALLMRESPESPFFEVDLGQNVEVDLVALIEADLSSPESFILANYLPAGGNDRLLKIRTDLGRPGRRSMTALATSVGVTVGNEAISFVGGETMPELKLDEYPLSFALVNNLNGQQMKTLVDTKVLGGREIADTTPLETALNEAGAEIPRGSVERISFSELPAYPEVIRRFLEKGLDRDRLELLVTAEVVQPRVQKIWTLDLLLFNSDRIDVELAELNDFSQTQIEIQRMGTLGLKVLVLDPNDSAAQTAFAALVNDGQSEPLDALYSDPNRIAAAESAWVQDLYRQYREAPEARAAWAQWFWNAETPEYPDPTLSYNAWALEKRIEALNLNDQQEAFARLYFTELAKLPDDAENPQAAWVATFPTSESLRTARDSGVEFPPEFDPEADWVIRMVRDPMVGVPNWTYSNQRWVTEVRADPIQGYGDWNDADLEFRSWLNIAFLVNTLHAEAELTGMRNAILGTLWMISLTILFAFPIGIGAAIYLEEYASDNYINRLIQTNIDNLAGVPSIIYGLLGVALFVRALEPITSGSFVGYGDETTANGRTVLAAAMTMALLILPIIIINAQEAIRAVQPSIRQASYGLGATKWQTVWKHVLPYSMPGILTGTILAVSRAIGETAPLIVVGATVYVVRDPDGPFSRFTALPVQIYNWTKLPREADKAVAAAAIIILLVILVTLNSFAIILRNRFERSTRR